MATLAILSPLRIEPAVKTLASFYILGHVTMVVAGEATLHLVSLFQSLMAAFTLLLELGMPGYHGAGHQNKI